MERLTEKIMKLQPGRYKFAGKYENRTEWNRLTGEVRRVNSRMHTNEFESPVKFEWDDNGEGFVVVRKDLAHLSGVKDDWLSMAYILADVVEAADGAEFDAQCNAVVAQRIRAACGKRNIRISLRTNGDGTYRVVKGSVSSLRNEVRKAMDEAATNGLSFVDCVRSSIPTVRVYVSTLAHEFDGISFSVKPGSEGGVVIAGRNTVDPAADRIATVYRAVKGMDRGGFDDLVRQVRERLGFVDLNDLL